MYMYRQVVILKVDRFAHLRCGQCGDRKDIEVGKPKKRDGPRDGDGIQIVDVTHVTRRGSQRQSEITCGRGKH